MNPTWRAVILVLIFTGSIFCKVWIYSQSQPQTDVKHSVQISYFKKTNDRSCAWNRLFKSRRRIEKYGFIQKAQSPTVPETFYSISRIFSPVDIQKPSCIKIFSLSPPPRLFSLV